MEVWNHAVFLINQRNVVILLNYYYYTFIIISIDNGLVKKTICKMIIKINVCFMPFLKDPRQI